MKVALVLIGVLAITALSLDSTSAAPQDENSSEVEPTTTTKKPGFWDKAKNFVKKAGDKVKDVAEKVGTKAKEHFEKVKEKISGKKTNTDNSSSTETDSSDETASEAGNSTVSEMQAAVMPVNPEPEMTTRMAESENSDVSAETVAPESNISEASAVPTTESSDEGTSASPASESE